MASSNSRTLAIFLAALTPESFFPASSRSESAEISDDDDDNGDDDGDDVDDDRVASSTGSLG